MQEKISQDQTNALRQSALTSSFWTLTEKVSLQAVQFSIGVIMARILGPESFGLIAMTTIFVAISGAISDAGFERAIINKAQVSNIQLCSIFYINLLLSCGLMIALIFSAPFISDFFSEPLLTNVLIVLSFKLPIDALGQVQRALLLKKLYFKKISIVQISSAIISAIVGGLMAYLGYGVWALVVSSLVGTIIWVTGYWIKSEWYPSFQFSLSSLRGMFNYGINVMATSLLYYVMQEINSLLIGRFYNKTSLGLYNRGVKLPELITSLVQSVIIKVSFPYFSSLKNDNTLITRAYLSCNSLAFFFTFPLLAFLHFNAENIVLLLLTKKWIGAVFFVKLFTFIKFIDIFIIIQKELIVAKEKPQTLFRTLMVVSVVDVLMIIISISYGILFFAGWLLLSRLTQYFIYMSICRRLLNKSLVEINAWIKPYFGVAISVSSLFALCSYLPGTYLKMGVVGGLCLSLFASLLMYIALVYFFKLKERFFLNTLYSVIFRKPIS